MNADVELQRLELDRKRMERENENKKRELDIREREVENKRLKRLGEPMDRAAAVAVAAVRDS